MLKPFLFNVKKIKGLTSDFLSKFRRKANFSNIKLLQLTPELTFLSSFSLVEFSNHQTLGKVQNNESVMFFALGCGNEEILQIKENS